VPRPDRASRRPARRRGGEHPYVVAQAAYLSANAVRFGEDAFELAGEIVEVDGVGHEMILSDRRQIKSRMTLGCNYDGIEIRHGALNGP
jgi:hypothetical protein